MLLGIDYVDGPIDEDYIYLNTRCRQCNTTNYHLMLIDTYNLLISPNRPNLQDILPDWTDGQREELISGTCPKCWIEMFSPRQSQHE